MPQGQRRLHSPAGVRDCAPRRGSLELEGAEVAAALEGATVARQCWVALGGLGKVMSASREARGSLRNTHRDALEMRDRLEALENGRRSSMVV